MAELASPGPTCHFLRGWVAAAGGYVVLVAVLRRSVVPAALRRLPGYSRLSLAVAGELHAAADDSAGETAGTLTSAASLDAGRRDGA